MLCNEESCYPNKIDAMSFFQDISLNTIEYMNQYQHLIAEGKYSDANQYINDKTGIYGYFACFFNMLENRIYELQNHLHQKEKLNPMFHQSEEPLNATANTTIWTGGHIHKYIDGRCLLCGASKYETAPANALNGWAYSLDNENSIVTLEYHGSNSKETNVTVYANYEINGAIYKTRLANGITYKTENYMFARNTNLKSVTFKEGIDTSNLTNLWCMFYGCSSLGYINFTDFNTSNVTNMGHMFNGCKNIWSLDLTSFNTNNVINMQSMFFNCSNLRSGTIQVSKDKWRINSNCNTTDMFWGTNHASLTYT